MIYIIVLLDFVDLWVNRLKKLFNNDEIFANAGLIASTICIIFVIPINEKYSVSFLIVLWFVSSIIKEHKDSGIS